MVEVTNVTYLLVTEGHSCEIISSAIVLWVTINFGRFEADYTAPKGFPNYCKSLNASREYGSFPADFKGQNGMCVMV